MLSNQLASLLTPFELLANRHALMPKYRCIEIGQGYIMACAPHAEINVTVETGLQGADAVQVEAVAFIACVKSLPTGKELSLSASNGALLWRCGQARGRLAYIGQAEMEPLPEGSGRGTMSAKILATAFELGALSCDERAIGNDNVYGVVIDNAYHAVYSTDLHTVSVYDIGNAIEGMPEVVTLAPTAVAVLSNIMHGGGLLECDRNSVYYYDEKTACRVNQVRPIKANLRSLLDQFRETLAVAVIPTDTIGTFIRRATKLTEDRRHAQVFIGAADGRVTMSFDEGAIVTDEYFLASELDGFPDMTPVAVPATKIIRALKHANTIALDYIDRGVIILQEQNGPFRYLISGTPRAGV